MTGSLLGVLTALLEEAESELTITRDELFTASEHLMSRNCASCCRTCRGVQGGEEEHEYDGNKRHGR